MVLLKSGKQAFRCFRGNPVMIGNKIEGIDQTEAIGSMIADELVDLRRQCRPSLGGVATQHELVTPQVGDEILSPVGRVNVVFENSYRFGVVDLPLDAVWF